MYTSSSTKNKTEPMTYFSYQILENAMCLSFSKCKWGEMAKKLSAPCPGPSTG